MKNEKNTHIDLFSGIGGFALAALWTGFKTIAFCERDEWCQKVLAKNFGAVVADTTSKQTPWEGSEGFQSIITQCYPPIIPDIHDFDGTQYQGATLLTGGFPCQPFSCAGKRQGKADDRYLWPEMFRIIAEARPNWIIAENVAGIVSMEQPCSIVTMEKKKHSVTKDKARSQTEGILFSILDSLERIGYSVQTFIIPACAVDAKHRRDRVWIVCHAEHAGLNATKIGRSIEQGSNGNEAGAKQASKLTGSGEQYEIMAHSTKLQCNTRSKITRAFCQSIKNGRELHNIDRSSTDVANTIKQQWNRWSDGVGWWEREPLETLRDAWRNGRKEDGLPTTESLLGRVAHGIPHRVDRLRGLGNAIVPQVAAEIMKTIAKIERE